MIQFGCGKGLLWRYVFSNVGLHSQLVPSNPIKKCWQVAIITITITISLTDIKQSGKTAIQCILLPIGTLVFGCDFFFSEGILKQFPLVGGRSAVLT